MTASAWQGPLISFGQGPSPDNNPDIAPSAFWGGPALLDARPFYTYQPGDNFGQLAAMFGAASALTTINALPHTASAVSIAPAAHPAAGVAMTLIASTVAGVTTGNKLTNPSTGASVTALLAIEGATALVSFGGANGFQMWDPGTMVARVVNVTSLTSGTGGHVTIKGFDVFGYPMTETITVPAGAAITAGLKAWKFIASVTPDYSDTINISVGTTDVYGFPFASLNYGGDSFVVVNGAYSTSAPTYTAAVNTLATATTGDVRGTFAFTSNNTNRLTVIQTPPPAALGLPNGVAGTSSGLFGVSQF